MIIEYLENSFSESEQKQIKDTFAKSNIEFCRKKPKIRQAAFDELFGQVVIFLSSNEVTAIVNGTALIGVIIGVIKYISNLAKKKRYTLLTNNSQSLYPMNVIIQVENVKILKPEKLNDEYLSVALSIACSDDIPKDCEIIISYDEKLRVETINQYVLRNLKKKGIGNVK